MREVGKICGGLVYGHERCYYSLSKLCFAMNSLMKDFILIKLLAQLIVSDLSTAKGLSSLPSMNQCHAS
jgi:hypothetical protein